MVFSSYVFLFWFLPGFLAVYYLLPLRAKNLALTIASFGFYGWWKPSYIALMAVSTVVDYACARAMGPAPEGDDAADPAVLRRRRLLLLLSVSVNLGLLAWFKYANLVVEGLNGVLGVLFEPAGSQAIDWEEVLLPLGISFYTFQSMSYSIDVYRGHVRPTRSVLDLACYVSMFPQLVAGPIVRYRDVQDQLVERRIDLAGLSDGVVRFATGFCKKVLIADRVAPLVAFGFEHETPGLCQAWVALVAYAVQIYFDFSGYSDMAIGLGRMLGFRFPENFHSPYRAHSITEFWRRWHISLSTWLRDYLYIPLGGNRYSSLRTYLNLWVTMLLGGLWHGAAWTFLAWGAWHGAFLAFERRLGKRAPYGFLPRPLQTLATFLIVLGGWLLFRAETWNQVVAMSGGLVGRHGVGAWPQPLTYVGERYLTLGAGLAIAFLLPRSQDLVARFRPLWVVAVMVLFALAVGELLTASHVPFLYWRF